MVFGVFIPLDWCWCWDTVTIARSVSVWYRPCYGINTPKTIKKTYGCTLHPAPDDGCMTSETCWAKTSSKEYCTSSWIRIKHMLPRCTEPQTLKKQNGGLTFELCILVLRMYNKPTNALLSYDSLLVCSTAPSMFRRIHFIGELFCSLLSYTKKSVPFFFFGRYVLKKKPLYSQLVVNTTLTCR
jgi:hypothetical protein